MWELYQRIYGGGPVIARNVIDIYTAAANTRLLDYRVDMSYYRKFDQTHQELLTELMRLKKMEKEEKKEGVIDEAYQKVKALARKYGDKERMIKHAAEVKKEEPTPNPVDLVKNLFARILK